MGGLTVPRTSWLSLLPGFPRKSVQSVGMVVPGGEADSSDHTQHCAFCRPLLPLFMLACSTLCSVFL